AAGLGLCGDGAEAFARLVDASERDQNACSAQAQLGGRYSMLVVVHQLERTGIESVGLLQALAPLGLLGGDAERVGRGLDRRGDGAALDCAREPTRLLEVVGVRFRELVAFLAGCEPARAADVELGTKAFRKPLVGDVADQGMLERELALATDGRRRTLLG